jgi:nicotinamidase-related amidase
MINNDNPALLLIDIQKGLDEFEYWGGERNNLHAEENMALLLNFWRTHHLPLFHIQHCSTNPNSPLAEGKIGNEIKEMVQPITGEPILKKNVNSAFIGTDLKEQLAQQGINTLVIIGLTTDHCVSTTTRMAGNLGFDTYLISDATATFNKKGIQGEHYSAELIHLTTLASLNEEFATVLTTEQLIKELIERF